MATMPAPETILVIGGGLGGLAFAQILRYSVVGDKYKVLIFERDASPKQRGQGYQIGLNRAGAAHIAGIPSVTAVLDAASKRRKENTLSIVDGELRAMMQVRGQADEVAALVNRSQLRHALADGLDVQWGKKLARYEESATHVVAHFEDGAQVRGDLLVGADGAKSRVRAQRCPALLLEEIPIVNAAGSTAITRATAPRVVDLARNTHLIRALAPGGNTVMLMEYDTPDSDTRLLWSYSFPATTDCLPTDPVELKQVIDARAAAVFSSELAAVIRDTAVEEYVFGAPRRLVATVVPAEVGENPLGTTTRVTLLGDAAHAMTTHRGLGANTAFADAGDLARALARVEDVWGALGEYEAVMVRRGFEAVRSSSQNTHLIHLVGVRGAVRDVVIRVVGWILWAKQLLVR